MARTARPVRPTVGPCADANRDEDELTTAARELVRRVRSQNPLGGGARPDPTRPHVLLEVEVDGLRCIVVRVPTLPERDSAQLSPREQEIARMVARGYANKTIAAVLDISTWTVGTYLRRIFAKLGVGTRAAMVANLQNPDVLTFGPIGQREEPPLRRAQPAPARQSV